jgi:sugar phosphate isomerase/epimerase
MIAANRRQFIAQVSIAAALGCAGGLARATTARSFPFGVQLFPVRDLLRKDVSGTLRALADIGFREIEMFGFGPPSTFTNDAFFGMDPKAFSALIRQLGITVPMVHYSGDAAGVAKSAELAHAIGCHTFIQPMASDFLKYSPEKTEVLPARNLEQFHGIATRLNELGRACKSSGLGFAYHNHHMEFTAFGGQRGYDVLLAETDPALVKLELDIGWAVAAGVDPVEYLTRHWGRYISCHLKDFNPKIPVAAASATVPIPVQIQMVPPGEGIIDFHKILAAMKNTGIQHGFLEVDIPQGDPLDVCRRGYKVLAAI